MKKIIKDAIELVKKLNDEFYEKVESNNSNSIFEVMTNGEEVIIQVFGSQTWSSVNDERQWDAATDAYELLEPFIRKEINADFDMISKMRF